MKKRKLANPTDFQRQYEEIGLGTEEERARYRRFDDTNPPAPQPYYTLQWFTDERDLELSKFKDG